MTNHKTITICLLALLALVVGDRAAAQTSTAKTMKTKTLIAYFSRRGQNYRGGQIVDLQVGNTEAVAAKIKALTGGDLFLIDPVKPYPADYYETTQQAKREQQNGARPKFKGEVQDMASYDTLYLGYPNWWGTMPMAVWTFLETYDFKGMVIKPFCTHEGSGLGHSEQDIRRLCPGASLMKGLAIEGGSVNDADKLIEAWVGK